MIKKTNMPKNILYLDNASTTIPYTCDLPENIWFNASASYQGGVEAKTILNKCKEDILKVFNLHKQGEVLFTSGATESNNIIVSTFTKILECDDTLRYNIVVSPIEHPSVLNIYKEFALNNKYDIRYLPIDKKGNIIIDQLNNIIDNNTLLVSCMYVNNETGNIQPIKKISEICNKNNALLHVDATQAVGKLSIDCKKDDIDFLTFSAHKFHGPKGIGVIICKDIDLYKYLDPLFFGGHQQDNKRPGTENVADIYLMTELLKCFCSEEMINKSQEISIFINNFIRETLNSIFNEDDFKINSFYNNIPICNISFKNVTGEYLVQMLSEENIYVSSGSACQTGLFENSYVLESMKIDDDFIEGTIRISFDPIDDNLTIMNIKNFIYKIKEIILK